MREACQGFVTRNLFYYFSFFFLSLTRKLHCPIDTWSGQKAQWGEVTEPYQKITLKIKDIDKTAAILDNKTDSKLDINTKLKRTGPGR